MEAEPPKLPEYRARIQEEYWYCFHCPEYRLGQGGIDMHVKTQHKEEMPQNGVDYAPGDDVVRIYLARHDWEQKAVARFHASIESLAGADDLAFEVKNGAGVPPYAKP
jgi:hypothetical protein